MSQLACPGHVPRSRSRWLFLHVSQLQKMRVRFSFYTSVNCLLSVQWPIIVRSELSQAGYSHTIMRITKTKGCSVEGEKQTFCLNHQSPYKISLRGGWGFTQRHVCFVFTKGFIIELRYFLLSICTDAK